MFKLTSAHLRALCDLNCFPVEGAGMVFFGLRGCLPVNTDNSAFAKTHKLVLASVDHTYPRCTIGQWYPADDALAVFAGSTVPHRQYVQTALTKGGEGANQLMTGYYADYRKGKHNPSKDAGHAAFRQTQGRPYRRTADDYDFDNDDRVEYGNPCDNLHAAWCHGTGHASYASAGCQVVVGYPACAKRGTQADTGPWAAFKRSAYDEAQDSFGYVLLDATSAQSVSLGAKGLKRRLRFGSAGDLVHDVQDALKKHGHYEGKLDGQFGERTVRAVLSFQTAAFGPAGDDGVVGPQTAQALGIPWP